jgi:hypothetical protein
MNRPVKFNTKAFISFLVLFIWIILVITGIVLYLSPPGRVANWVEWRFFGLTKEDWQSIHTIFSFTFIIIAALHLYYNWIVFWSYLKSKVAQGIKMKRELLLAGSLVMVTGILVLMELPPFQNVMDFGEYLSDSWSNEKSEPPIPHAELMTLSEYAVRTKQNNDILLKSLTKLSVQPVDTLMTIAQIANLNGLSPRDLIALLNQQPPQTSQYLGYGRKNFSIVCQELGISQETALQKLSEKNIFVKEDKILKEIADEYDLKPIDIIKIIGDEGDH